MIQQIDRKWLSSRDRAQLQAALRAFVVSIEAAEHGYTAGSWHASPRWRRAGRLLTLFRPGYASIVAVHPDSFPGEEYLSVGFQRR